MDEVTWHPIYDHNSKREKDTGMRCECRGPGNTYGLCKAPAHARCHKCQMIICGGHCMKHHECVPPDPLESIPVLSYEPVIAPAREKEKVGAP